jgi:hypothetical protein
MAATRKLRSVNDNTVTEEVVPENVHIPAVHCSSEPLPAGVIEGGAPQGTETTNAVATRTTRALAPMAASSGIVGEWDSGDVKFPALKIVQGSGQLSQQFNSGTLILGDEELLPPPDLKNPKPEHTFRFVPVTLEKQFRENLSQEEAASGAMPRVVSSLAEVEALGGTTQWIGDQKPSWGPSARILLLVERPENLPGSGTDHPGFVLELGGKLYAPAVYYAAGTSWTNFAKPLFNAALTSLMIPERDEAGNIVKTPTGVIRRQPYLPKSFWAWRTVKKAAGDYVVFAPEVRLHKEETGDELRQFVESLR